MDARGVIIWLFLTVVIFVMVLGYTTMSRVLTGGGVWEDIKSIEEIDNSTDAESVISTNETVWQFFPYLGLLAFLIWGVFASGG